MEYVEIVKTEIGEIPPTLSQTNNLREGFAGIEVLLFVSLLKRLLSISMLYCSV